MDNHFTPEYYKASMEGLTKGEEWQFLIALEDQPLDIRKVEIGRKYKVKIGRMTIEMTGFEIQQNAYHLDQILRNMTFLFKPLRPIEV